MEDMWELNVENSDETNCAIMYKKENHFWWKPVKCSDSYYGLCVKVTNGRIIFITEFLYMSVFKFINNFMLIFFLSQQILLLNFCTFHKPVLNAVLIIMLYE